MWTRLLAKRRAARSPKQLSLRLEKLLQQIRQEVMRHRKSPTALHWLPLHSLVCTLPRKSSPPVASEALLLDDHVQACLGLLNLQAQE